MEPYGQYSFAEKMIKAAAKAGADFCKFQTWSVDNLKKVLGTRMVEGKIYEKAQLSLKIT